MTTPTSRIPVGEQALTMKPSLLDYAFATPSVIRNSELHWEGAPADHAISCFWCNPVVVARPRVKSNWVCSNKSACSAWLQQHTPGKVIDIDDLQTVLRKGQALFSDTRPCSDRRRTRLPLQLRDLYARLAAATDEETRHQLQRQAWLFQKKMIEDSQLLKVVSAVKRGRVLQRSKKLYEVSSLILPTGHPPTATHGKKSWRSTTRTNGDRTGTRTDATSSMRLSHGKGQVSKSHETSWRRPFVI